MTGPSRGGRGRADPAFGPAVGVLILAGRRRTDGPPGDQSTQATAVFAGSAARSPPTVVSDAAPVRHTVGESDTAAGPAATDEGRLTTCALGIPGPPRSARRSRRRAGPFPGRAPPRRAAFRRGPGASFISVTPRAAPGTTGPRSAANRTPPPRHAAPGRPQPFDRWGSTERPSHVLARRGQRRQATRIAGQGASRRCAQAPRPSRRPTLPRRTSADTAHVIRGGVPPTSAGTPDIHDRVDRGCPTTLQGQRGMGTVKRSV
jgi:hypothetical protein